MGSYGTGPSSWRRVVQIYARFSVCGQKDWSALWCELKGLEGQQQKSETPHPQPLLQGLPAWKHYQSVYIKHYNLKYKSKDLISLEEKGLPCISLSSNIPPADGPILIATENRKQGGEALEDKIKENLIPLSQWFEAVLEIRSSNWKRTPEWFWVLEFLFGEGQGRLARVKGKHTAILLRIPG